MRASPVFYILHLLHIVALEALAYFVVWYLDGSLAAFFVAAVILATEQVSNVNGNHHAL